MRYSTLRENDGWYWIQVSLGSKSCVFSIHSATPLEDLADTLGTISEHHGFRFHREQAEEKGFRIAHLNRLEPEVAEVQTVATMTA